GSRGRGQALVVFLLGLVNRRSLLRRKAAKNLATFRIAEQQLHTTVINDAARAYENGLHVEK
ncbi:MAG TPA: hypothetical protein DFI00_11095, partial [Rhodospirillaceae bacterium]|nr:hypothetical protein [Rhodospirillaceae bacterium]